MSDDTWDMLIAAALIVAGVSILRSVFGRHL
jgi:hypothetical protein